MSIYGSRDLEFLHLGGAIGSGLPSFGYGLPPYFREAGINTVSQLTVFRICIEGGCLRMGVPRVCVRMAVITEQRRSAIHPPVIQARQCEEKAAGVHLSKWTCRLRVPMSFRCCLHSGLPLTNRGSEPNRLLTIWCNVLNPECHAHSHEPCAQGTEGN